MTAQSWSDFGQLIASDKIQDIPALEHYQNQFPELRLGDTADFNHFSFYSLLAALLSKLVMVFGINLPAHKSFIYTHALLFSVPLILSFRRFGWQGLSAVILLTVFSPMLWFTDKVHTEFFTYCLALSAVIVILKKEYILAAFFLALASTQNISFAAISGLIVLYSLFADRSEKLSRSQLILLSLTCVIVCLHPLYYYSRYGVITPQLLAGGAGVGYNLKYFWVWFFEPDIGLIGNWCLGLLILVPLLFSKSVSEYAKDKSWYYFLLAYLVISLFAQSSTYGLNSGGTISIARYATWYIPLFFPYMLMSLNWVLATKYNRGIIAIGVILCSYYSYQNYNPSLPENFHTPTKLSYFIQSKMPWAYDPPADIFVGRYSDLRRIAENDNFAVIGPDCRKILILRGQGTFIQGNRICSYDPILLTQLITSKIPDGMPGQPFYYRLTDAEIKNIQKSYATGDSINLSADEDYDLIGCDIQGFGGPENIGRWTISNKSSIQFEITAVANSRPKRVLFSTTGFVAKGHKQRMIVSINNSQPVEYFYVAEKPDQDIELLVPEDSSNLIRIKFELPDAISPKDLGLSNDPRDLGVSIKTIKLL